MRIHCDVHVHLALVGQPNVGTSSLVALLFKLLVWIGTMHSTNHITLPDVHSASLIPQVALAGALHVAKRSLVALPCCPAPMRFYRCNCDDV